MNRDWKWKIPVAIFGICCVIWIGLLLQVRHKLESLDFSGPNPQVGALQAELKEITKLALRDKALPMRKFDPSSIGFKPVESEELDLRRDVNIFESSQKRLPVDFKDLQNGVKLPGTWAEKLTRYAKECGIVILNHESYILNCDGWMPANAEELNSLVHSFDSRTGRFYEVQNHVLLYSPPPITTTLSSSNQN
jgi:hypothetical protein